MNTGARIRDEQLFADVLARPKADRALFLAQSCNGDASLLARIAALVAAHEGPESLTSPAAGARSSSMSDEQPGELIGRYKLLQKIGEGGCGVVWMAEQEEPVRRRVALKVIKLGMDTKAVVARFEAERQALAMMDHPNIAKVHDAGATETGRPFFVMELVRGIPITKYCDENHLDPTARLELFIKVCQAIQHAHQKGIIHRDIKPSNILVTVNDGQPTPKVIDFGIAKATQGKLTDATVFTAFEQFIGTPVYMSPEQAEMSSLDIDTRSDIYSLGVLLYELLTGRPPFDPKKFAEAGVEGIRQQIREVEPPRPSARLRTLDDEERTTIARLRNTAASQLSLILRGDLDWIVMRCIEKDRTRRYDTANGLAADIQRYLRNEPVVARPPSTAYLLQKLIRRHRVGFAATMMVFAAVMTGGIVSAYQAFRATRAEAEQSRLRAQSEEARKQQSKLRARAEVGELQARRASYAAEMNIAQQALADGNLNRAESLLEKYVPKPGEVDLRGFEWRHLWERTRSDELATLGRIGGRATVEGVLGGGVTLSPNGSLLAHRGENDTVEIRSFPANDLVRILSNVPVGVLRFSPDGQWLILGTVGRQFGSARGVVSAVLRRFNTRTWEEAPPFEGVGSPFGFAQRGRILVAHESSSGRNHLALWSTDSWSKIRELPNTVGDIALGSPSIESSIDGNTIFFRDGPAIRSWDLAQDRELETLSLPSGSQITCMAISPAGLLAASSRDGRVTLWDPRSKTLLQTFEQHKSWTTTVAFSPDGSVLASGSSDQTIVLYDVQTRAPVRRLKGHRGEVFGLEFSRDGNHVVSASPFDFTVRLWPVRDARERMKKVKASLALEFVDSNQGLICWSPENNFTRYDFRTGEQISLGLSRSPYPLDPHNRTTRVARNVSAVAYINRAREVEIWNLHTGTREQTLRHATGAVTKIAFSPDNAFFATAADNAEILVWKTDDWSSRSLPTKRGIVVARVAFTPDGSLFVVFADGTFRLFNPASDVPPLEYAGRPFGGGAAFSQDGTKVAMGQLGGENRIAIWELTTGEQIASLTGHLAGVWGLDISPDGLRLASCGDDNLVKIWSLESFQEILTLPSTPANSVSAMFSPDGTWLAVSTPGSDVQLWHAPSLAEIEREKATKPRQRIR